MISSFRTSFKLANENVLHWFPGHMNKGLKQIEKKLKSVDCLIEIHDARIPFSGRNIRFKDYTQGKPHILVLNKKDLTNLVNIKSVLPKLDADNILFTNCKDPNCKGVKEIVPTAVDLIKKSARFHRNECDEYTIMIIGVPNVGKSSLINILRNKHLRKGNATAVGAIAGITRSVLTRIKVCQEPAVYLLDTPGILNPKINNNEDGLKLALVSTMQDHLVGPILIADYLLYLLNKMNHFEYVNYLDINEPNDSIVQVLTLTAVKLNKMLKRRNLESGSIQLIPNLDAAAHYFINAFREGKLGKIMLD